jgi:ComF family protein
VGCGRQGFVVCPECLKKAERAELVCPECGRLAVGGNTHLGCQQRDGLDGLVAIWRYRGVVREAVKQFKFKFVKEAGKDLAREAIGVIENDGRFLDFRNLIDKSVIWTGVPLHRVRENWRGFNQAELIAREMAKGLGGEFIPGLVERRRYTEHQAGLARRQRGENVEGVFGYNLKFEIRNLKLKTVVVVDDVWTTGATMKECARVLKKAGAERVWGMVLAR